jgi:hypothetical protein
VISVGALTPILFASQAGDYATFKFQPMLVLYTGAAVIDGADAFKEAAGLRLSAADLA